MTNHSLPLATLAARPWAIYKPGFATILDQVRVRASGIARMTTGEIEAAVVAAASAPLGKMIGSIAVIPVTGCITQKSDFWSWYFGGTSIERLTAAFRAYVNDPAVSAIVFDHDSPGGEVFGVPEFAEEVFATRDLKKTVAVSNPFMASASYWIGAACSEVYLIPSGQAGSVGCYTMHEDLSKMLEQIGVDITLIQYGAHKTEGNPFEALSEEAHAEFQAGVDHYGRWFDGAVAKFRGISTSDVRANFGQGRVLRAPDAKKVNMVDKIMTFDDVIAKLSPKRSRSLTAMAGATMAATEKCPACNGSGLKPERHMGDPQGQEPCEQCKGAGAIDAHATAAAAITTKTTATIEPDENGDCPEGYDKRDGMCYPKDTEDAAAVAAQRQADQDAIDVTLTLTE